MCDLFPIYLLFTMEPFLFENVGQILDCILYCITAFKIEKNALKNQQLSEVPIWGGAGLKTSDKV